MRLGDLCRVLGSLPILLPLPTPLLIKENHQPREHDSYMYSAHPGGPDLLYLSTG